MKPFTKAGLSVFEYYNQIRTGERQAELEDKEYMNTTAFHVDHMHREMNAMNREKADIARLRLEAETDYL